MQEEKELTREEVNSRFDPHVPCIGLSGQTKKERREKDNPDLYSRAEKNRECRRRGQDLHSRLPTGKVKYRGNGGESSARRKAREEESIERYWCEDHTGTGWKRPRR